MPKGRSLGLLLIAVAAWAQQGRPVEITSEPSHHLVLQNEYVRVFDVTVAPKSSTLIHRHNSDYLFVTLGDSDITNARVGEKPVRLTLKDGEVRFTPGNFAHAAINNSDQPFHNITIELLKPSTNVKTCKESCSKPVQCVVSGIVKCPTIEERIASDQWVMSLVDVPGSAKLERAHSSPQLIIAVSTLDFSAERDNAGHRFHRSPGGLAWTPGGPAHTIINSSAAPAKFVTLEFKTAN